MTSLARATALMSLGTILSRITGLARLAAMAAALGVAESRLPDAYNLANTAPNIIYELVLGGVLTSVFVPVFVELLEKEGREKAWQVASAIINLVLVVLVAITALGMIAAPAIARLYTLALEGEVAELQRDVLTFLLRLFLPQIIFYGIAATTAGLLNAHKRFGAPMYTPILNNLAVIAVFIGFHAAYPSGADLGSVTNTQLLIVGLGTTAGVALMALGQLPFLRGLGRYRLTLSISHPAIGKLARLSVFVIGYVVVNQIGYLIVQVLANDQQGGYSAYIAAFTFFLLPHGLFAVSVITALLPDMSSRAGKQNWAGFKEQLSVGIRATVLLVLPAAVGYLMLSREIIELLLERGVFSSASTALVAEVLRYFVIGLVPFSLFQLFLRAFYAMQNTRTPFVINCAAVAFNIAVNLVLFPILGVGGLALGLAGAYTFGLLVQVKALRRRIGRLDGTRIVRSIARMAAAAAVMAVAIALLVRLGTSILGESPGDRLLTLLVTITLGAVTYIGSARLFGVEELSLARGVFTRRVVPAQTETNV